MKIGVILPNPGVLMDLETLLAEMSRAEERGMQSLWVANVHARVRRAHPACAGGAAYSHGRTGYLRCADLSAPSGRARPAGADDQCRDWRAARARYRSQPSRRDGARSRLRLVAPDPAHAGVPHLPDRITLRRAGDIRGRGVPHHEFRRSPCRARRRPPCSSPRSGRRCSGSPGGTRTVPRSGWVARAISPMTPSRRSPPPRRRLGDPRRASSPACPSA